MSFVAAEEVTEEVLKVYGLFHLCDHNLYHK